MSFSFCLSVSLYGHSFRMALYKWCSFSDDSKEAYFPEPGHFTNHSSGQDWNHYIDVNNRPEKFLEPFEESYPVISIGCLSMTSGHSFIMALNKCASFSDEWIHEEKWQYWSGSGRDLQKSCFGHPYQHYQWTLTRLILQFVPMEHLSPLWPEQPFNMICSW